MRGLWLHDGINSRFTPGNPDVIEYKEWSIKNKKGTGKLIEMNGKVLPTIGIQGDLLFESVIAQYEEHVGPIADPGPSPKLATKNLEC